MGCTRMILGALGGATVVGGLNAGFNAASGAIGAAILSTGYDDYNATEGANMGAVGGAIIGGSLGAIAGGVVGAMNGGSVSVKVGTGGGLISAAAAAVISGLVGYGVLNSAASETVMNVGQTALSFLIGGPIMSVGTGLLLACVILPCAGVVAMSDKTPELEKAPDLENPEPEAPTSMGPK